MRRRTDILVYNDDPELAENLASALLLEGYRATSSHVLRDVLELLNIGRPVALVVTSKTSASDWHRLGDVARHHKRLAVLSSTAASAGDAGARRELLERLAKLAKTLDPAAERDVERRS